LLVITDTGHHVRAIIEILLDIGDQVQGVYQEVSKLVAGIEAIQEQLTVGSCKRHKTDGVCIAKISGHECLQNSGSGTPG
jgi:hypothetical protein